MRDRLRPDTHPSQLARRTGAVSAAVHTLQKELAAAKPEDLPSLLARTLAEMQTMADCIDVLMRDAARRR